MRRGSPGSTSTGASKVVSGTTSPRRHPKPSPEPSRTSPRSDRGALSSRTKDGVTGSRLTRVIAPVVVVGAGPAGLAVAGALSRADVPCAVLERGPDVGPAWQGRYDSLRLHTARWLSGLPAAPIPRRYGRWVARDDFVTYLREYADRFEVHPEFGVELHRIDRQGEGWRLETSHGARDGPHGAVATGYSRGPGVPNRPGRQTLTPGLGQPPGQRHPPPHRPRPVAVRR